MLAFISTQPSIWSLSDRERHMGLCHQFQLFLIRFVGGPHQSLVGGPTGWQVDSHGDDNDVPMQTLSRQLHFRLFGVQRQAKDGKMSLNRHRKGLILRFFSWHKLHQNVKGVGFTRTMAMMPKWPRTPALAVRGVSRNAQLLWSSTTAVLCPNVWLRMDAGWRGLVIFGWVGVVLLWWWLLSPVFFLNLSSFREDSWSMKQDWR